MSGAAALGLPGRAVSRSTMLARINASRGVSSGTAGLRAAQLRSSARPMAIRPRSTNAARDVPRS